MTQNPLCDHPVGSKSSKKEKNSGIGCHKRDTVKKASLNWVLSERIYASFTLVTLVRPVIEKFKKLVTQTSTHLCMP